MKTLNKKTRLIYLILNIITLGLFTFYVAYKLNLYEEKTWYSRWYYWILGFLFGIIPGLLMLFIFSVKIGTIVSAKLNVPGKELYLLPYPWIICAIIPILGWVIFIILYIYTHFWYVFYLEK